VDKFIIPCIDTDMVDDAIMLFGGIKKDQIPLFELPASDLLANPPCMIDVLGIDI